MPGQSLSHPQSSSSPLSPKRPSSFPVPSRPKTVKPRLRQPAPRVVRPTDEPIGVAPILLERNGGLGRPRCRPRLRSTNLPSPLKHCSSASSLRQNHGLVSGGEGLSEEVEFLGRLHIQETSGKVGASFKGAETTMSRRMVGRRSDGDLADDEGPAYLSSSDGSLSHVGDVIMEHGLEAEDVWLQADGMEPIEGQQHSSSELSDPPSLASTEVSFNINALDPVWEDFWVQQAQVNSLIANEDVAAGLHHDDVRGEARDLVDAMLQRVNREGTSRTWQAREERAFYQSTANLAYKSRPDVVVYALAGPLDAKVESTVRLLVEVKPFDTGIKGIGREADNQIRSRARQAAEAGELDRLIMISVIGHSVRFYYWQKKRAAGDHELGSIRPNNQGPPTLKWRHTFPPIDVSAWLPLSAPSTRVLLQRVIVDCTRSASGEDPIDPTLYGPVGRGVSQLPLPTNSDSSDLALMTEEVLRPASAAGRATRRGQAA